MDVVVALVADAQPPVLVQPTRVRPRDGVLDLVTFAILATNVLALVLSHLVG